jgi:hypothetical protein
MHDLPNNDYFGMIDYLMIGTLAASWLLAALACRLGNFDLLKIKNS